MRNLKLLPCEAYPSTYLCLVKLAILVLFLKLLPCQGEVARSAETEGFYSYLCQAAKYRSGSAENPSVSPALSLSKVLRDPPSLRSRLRSKRATPCQGEGASLSSIYAPPTYV